MTYTLSPWSLDDLFPSLDSPEMQAAFEELEAQVLEFEALRPSLAPGMLRDRDWDKRGGVILSSAPQITRVGWQMSPRRSVTSKAVSSQAGRPL